MRVKDLAKLSLLTIRESSESVWSFYANLLSLKVKFPSDESLLLFCELPRLRFSLKEATENFRLAASLIESDEELLAFLISLKAF